MTDRYEGKQRFKPLPKAMIGPFDAAAQNMDNQLTRLTARVILHTGMRNTTYHHSRGRWATDQRIEGKPVIRVPLTEKCIGGAGKTGEGNSSGENLHHRGSPCYACRSQRDGNWTPKTKNSVRPIPVMEEEVFHLFQRWFDYHDQIPLLHSAVNDRLQSVADAAGLNRRVVAHDLRHTYGTMLARMGFNPPSIAAVMGHGSLNMPMKYIKFTGNDLVNDFKKHWDFDEYRNEDNGDSTGE